MLAGHPHVLGPADDEALLGAWTVALDAYEEAKRVLGAARTETEARSSVRRVLDTGREAIARVDSRSGREAPQSSPCFFDPRHGRSTARLPWAPPGGASRLVPVCAADAVRLQEGRPKRGGHRPPQRERPKRGDRDERHPRRTVVRLDSPGPQEFRHHWTPEAPAVLVLRAVSYGKPMSTTLRKLRRGDTGFLEPRDLVLKARGDFSARLPVPPTGRPDGGSAYRVSGGKSPHEGIRPRGPYDTADFDVDRIPYWETWLEPVGACREFSTSISGDGWDVIRYTGGRATARLTYGGRKGEIVVDRLDRQFHAVQRLFHAPRPILGGASLSLPPKPAWLAVQCQGTWTLDVGRDGAAPPASA
ncbi:hypothetical protein BBN63_03120 [Streptomyces niveus]|uniref:Uncharacterized protein n=2 Tax=Streptomyces niveus TaxID=193462 RepID=A0A1U9QMB3_STRNV|nr:hypothetical protein BBN63_03120 [Streptomyces niveus]